jgi:toxin CcdB
MRFDVFSNDSPQTRKRYPYLLVLQSEFLRDLDTTVVAPLGKPAVVEGNLAQTLTPLLDVDGEKFAMYTPELAMVPNARLKKCVANLSAQHGVIVRALDFLFEGI